ncbi:GntR family transcriptional regulator [Dellaglioa sp. BT-FLS60]
MNTKIYLYQKIYQELKNAIQNGSYQLDDQLPTEKQLMKDYSVSRMTAKNALNLLVEEGLIYRVSGKGSFVNENIDLFTKTSIPPQKNNLIGIILSGFADSYGSVLLKSLIKYCEQAHYHVLIKLSQESQQLETQYIDELLSLNVSGIIILPVQAEFHNPELLKITLSNFPIVLIDKKLEGVNVPYVGSNNFDSSKEATENLINQGHTNLSIVANKSVENSSLTDRISGVKEAFSEKKIIPNEALWITDLESSYSDASTQESIQRDLTRIYSKLTEQPEITCFFAMDYLSAQLLALALDNLKKNIPSDFSLISFDGPKHSYFTHPFSRIIQNEPLIAQKSVELLHDQIENNEIKQKNYIIDTEFIDKHSISVI